ncbi:MAG: hypothetical protein MR474_06320, partial [Megasphaera elsdenii]|nr:hypothetical protein [Megasphaera elsdenii]
AYEKSPLSPGSKKGAKGGKYFRFYDELRIIAGIGKACKIAFLRYFKHCQTLFYFLTTKTFLLYHGWRENRKKTIIP